MQFNAGAVLRNCSRFFFVLIAASAGCSLTTVRPVQLMSDTAAAIRAADESQARTLAPELFRQSLEWYYKAKNEYKLKNFDLAIEYASKSRSFAEQAEYIAIKNGAKMDAPPPDQSEEPPKKPEAYAYPTPTPTPADVYEDRLKKETEAASGNSQKKGP